MSYFHVQLQVIKCNSINFQEITFHYKCAKLYENAVTFNRYYNIITCNLATILAANLINKERKKTDGGITQTRVRQCNQGISYQRDEPGAGHRGLAPARTQITRAGAETNTRVK